MQAFEYKVVPAPTRGEKARGLKTGAEKFAYALTQAINAMADEGWEYCRAETLPSEERTGLTSKTTVYHNLLVFRRPALAGRPARAAAPETAIESPVQKRALQLSAQSPEGKAPRLGPAEDEEV